MEYRIIRSDRRTLAIEITVAGEILVRVPRRVSDGEAMKFVEANKGWIETHAELVKRHAELHPEPSEAEREAYIAAAREYIPDRVRHFAEIMGVAPEGIRITDARRRFGSCSGKNRLCFSWRVMEYPTELVDYVIVHELAHIKHHNHSMEFYRFVSTVMPDYRERQRRLKYE